MPFEQGQPSKKILRPAQYGKPCRCKEQGRVHPPLKFQNRFAKQRENRSQLKEGREFAGSQGPYLKLHTVNNKDEKSAQNQKIAPDGDRHQPKRYFTDVPQQNKRGHEEELVGKRVYMGTKAAFLVEDPGKQPIEGIRQTGDQEDDKRRPHGFSQQKPSKQRCQENAPERKQVWYGHFVSTWTFPGGANDIFIVCAYVE